MERSGRKEAVRRAALEKGSAVGWMQKSDLGEGKEAGEALGVGASNIEGTRWRFWDDLKRQ